MKAAGKTQKIILLSLLLFVPGLTFHLCNSGEGNLRKLPYYGHYELVEGYDEDSSRVIDTVYNSVPAFSFTNQYGESVTEEDVEGKIYVVEFFFTTCPSACPIMNKEMARVQEEFKTIDNFMIISHTVDPEKDSLPVLREYADRFNAIPGKWNFVTGDADDIYKTATHYLIGAGPGEPVPLHGSEFALLDTERKIRGLYDGMDSLQVEKMMDDVFTLLRKEELKKITPRRKTITVGPRENEQS